MMASNAFPEKERQTPVTQDELIFLVKEYLKKIPEQTVYYPLRLWGLKRIKKQTVQIVRACIALDDMKLPITANLVCAILGRQHSNATSSMVVNLHGLGDKGVILLTKESINIRGRPLVWIMNDEFRKTVRHPIKEK